MKKWCLITIVAIIAIFVVAELLVILLVKDKELCITLATVICSLPISAVLVSLCGTVKDSSSEDKKE